jgi:hypothetical protein
MRFLLAELAGVFRWSTALWLLSAGTSRYYRYEIAECIVRAYRLTRDN